MSGLVIPASIRALGTVDIAALYAVLVWAPLAWGGYRDWPLAVTQLLSLLGLLCWILGMVAAGRLSWRRTSLDLPLGLLVALVVVQIAVGNRPLSAWALALPADPAAVPIDFPRVLLMLGTVSPAQTSRSLRLLLTYAAVYVLVVNLVRTRRQIERLVLTLVLLGSVLAFFGLLDYLAGQAWTLRWRDSPSPGRLAGSFVNPDHFAAWLVMLICLGLGLLMTSRGQGGPSSLASVRAALTGSRETRERAVRRALPFVGVAVMALALLFTLSRAGILSLLVALAAVLILGGALGRARWSVVLVGALLAVVLTYGAWIGLGPLLDRVRHGAYENRWLQLTSSVPMLASFPVLGVGLGAYREIYFRYQPPELAPGRLFFPHAHNDLLQIVLETGLVGLGLLCLAVWRVGSDLIRAHLLGRGRCPVGGGEDDGARRRDPLSVGLALGAIGAVVALLAHSAFDFGARIPANGVLGAACLGIATVALHTRYEPGRERLLCAVRVRPLRRGRAIIGAGVVLASVAVVPAVVRPALVDLRLASVPGPGALARAERVVSLDPGDARALEVRAKLRAAAALDAWNAGAGLPGAPGSIEERRSAARPLLTGAIADLRRALESTPTNPYLHEALAETHASRARIDPATAKTDEAAAFAALSRAIALAPGNPMLYRSLSILALGRGEPDLGLALSAARDAVARDPSLLPDLAERFLPFALSPSQWARLAPATTPEQLQLGAVLEMAGLGQEAQAAYGRAAALASPADVSAPLWLLARLLTREGLPAAALDELGQAIERDPGNPELELARARALARRRDPAEIDALRTAVVKAEQRGTRPTDDVLPFRAPDPRMRSVLLRALGRDGSLTPTRYRAALAQRLIELGLWEQALAAWDRVLEEDIRDARAHLGRGTALQALGRREDAVEAYRHAVSLDAGRPAFRLRLAAALWETEQFYQAVNEWRAVIALDPGDLGARLALAGGYLKIGERAEAAREYRRVLEMDPGQPEARRALARLGRPPGS